LIKFKIFLLLCTCAASTYAQTASPLEAPPFETTPVSKEQKPVAQNDKVYELFELSKLPAFPGGESDMYKFIAKQLQYPAEAREKHIKGTVLLSFEVNTIGKVGNVQVIKDIGGGCGIEARRVVLTMPDWVPGEFEGQVVKSRYSMPFKFNLN